MNRLLLFLIVASVTLACYAAGLLPSLPEPREIRSDTIIFIRTNVTTARTPRFTEEVTTEYWEEQQHRVFDKDPFMSDAGSRITYSTNWFLLGKFTKEGPVQPPPDTAPMKSWQGQQPPIPPIR